MMANIDYSKANCSLVAAAKELRLRGQVRYPTLKLEITNGKNQSFPYRFCAGFMRGNPAVDDEELVISVDVWTAPDGLLISADIAAGSGRILREWQGICVRADAANAQISIES